MSKVQFPLLEKCNPQNCIVSKTMKINRLMNSLFRKHLSDIDITLSQLSIMFLVSKKETISQNTLGEILYLEKSTVTRNLKRLILSGYLKKKEGNVIAVTVKGKRLVERTIPNWENAMNEAKLKIKNEGEQALHLVLHRLTD